ncbi:hypothetical protein Q5762_37745, partial [Streptomyces sp. P9(2023)]|uniref:hypothetical protein n=1 Tax=Streptomyces sp. P9(2023) TaxID=3064394 RepID=UPI0028F44CA4
MPAVVDSCEAYKERSQTSPFVEHQYATPIQAMMSKPPAHTVMAATVAMVRMSLNTKHQSTPRIGVL